MQIEIAEDLQRHRTRVAECHEGSAFTTGVNRPGTWVLRGTSSSTGVTTHPGAGRKV
jgi:hypothetical protein